MITLILVLSAILMPNATIIDTHYSYTQPIRIEKFNNIKSVNFVPIKNVETLSQQVSNHNAIYYTQKSLTRERIDEIILKYSVRKKPRLTADMIITDSVRTGTPVELYLIMGIAETNLGTAGVGKTRNNPYSIKCGRVYCNYRSIEEGIRAFGDWQVRWHKKYNRTPNIEYFIENILPIYVTGRKNGIINKHKYWNLLYGF